jgi:transcriptional regulator with XRE-family HTH domain
MIGAAMSENFYKVVGQRIKQARKGKYSQKDLARVLGYSQAAISKFELGQRVISLPDLHKLSEFLEKPLSYFIDDPHSSTQAIAGHLEILDNLELSLLPVYNYPQNLAPSEMISEKPAEYITMPRQFKQGAHFAVKLLEKPNDNSLGLRLGDVLLVHRQSTANEGDIVIVQEQHRLIISRLEESLRPPIIGKVIRLIRDI